MTPTPRTPRTLTLLCLGFLFSIAFIADAQAQQVQVNAADPTAAEQGTTTLDVKVTGKGFKNGAKAKWFVTGTTDPGGVTVNSTTFVSSSELRANLTVSDTAAISTFDIEVLNNDGRGGKGTELFRVTVKSSGANASCPPIQPAPTSDTKCYGNLPGCLDATFGGAGFVHIDPTGGPTDGEVADAVSVQPDGKIVVAGRTRTLSEGQNLAVLRFNDDGTFDTTFGDQDPLNPSLRRGYTVTSIPGLSYSMALQPDGKIIICGRYFTSVVVRYNSDGTPDLSFGSGGVVSLPDGVFDEVALQADGKIVLGGGERGFSVARLNPNGSFDSSFGSGGIVTANPSGAKRGTGKGWGLAIQRVPAVTGEERIVVAGWSRGTSGEEAKWTLMRFRSNGSVDTTFGVNGVVKTAFYGFSDQARQVRIDASNRLVVAGLIYSASGNCGDHVIDAAVVRYLQNGSIDASFSGGKQIVDVHGGQESLYTLELQADGKIVTLMTAASSDVSVRHFALVRLNPDGSRDSTFGMLGNGVVTTDFYGLQDWGFALAFQPADGKIVAAGIGYQGFNPASTEMVIARYLP